MAESDCLYKCCDAFTSERHDDVLLLRFVDKPFIFTLDMGAKNRFVECLQSVALDDRIKSVVLFGRSEKAGAAEFVDFFEKALLPEADQKIMHKMLNIFNQFMLTVLDLDKFVVSAEFGPLVSQFFYAGLVCDYRIMAEGSVVQNAFLRADMPPKGGGPFFLPHMVSRRVAYELLTEPGDITAEKLHGLGLVDEVVPAADMEQAAMHAAHKFAAVPGNSLAGIKKFMNYELRRQLSRYLEFENQEVLKAYNAARLRLARCNK